MIYQLAIDLFGIVWFMSAFFGLYIFLFKSDNQWAWVIPLIMLLGASLIVYFNLNLGRGCIQTLELKGNTLFITHGRLFLRYTREMELSSFNFEEFFPSNAFTGKYMSLKERLAIPVVNNIKWYGRYTNWTILSISLKHMKRVPVSINKI